VIVRLHRHAEAEIREATTWYRSQADDLDRRFIQAVRNALEMLERDPYQFARLETAPNHVSFRRALVDDFPYIIVYEVVEKEIFVYAVAHASRRPNYWRRRKRNSH